MKYLILICLIFSFNSFAWTSKSELLNCEIMGKDYTLRSRCDSFHNDCIQIPKNFNCETFVEVPVMEDDLSKPVWASRSMVEPCDGEQDCINKMAEKECSDPRIPYRNAENTEIWCNTITGFEQMETGSFEIVEDPAKKSLYDAAKVEAETKKAQIAAAVMAMDKGREIIALMGIRNNAKGLSVGQVKQFLNTFGDIKAMLESGALITAKEEIEAITPDAIITTQADKDAILAEINSFLGL